MKILNVGSLNLDRVYQVDHFIAGKETLAAARMDTFAGGKGLNQSVACARAGAEVWHYGAIGTDGLMLKQMLEDSGVHTGFLKIRQDQPTGHAIIQVVPSGENGILILAGANDTLTRTELQEAAAGFGAGDVLLVQNETNLTEEAMRLAKEKGMLVACNASPINDAILHASLDLVDLFLINEVEGRALAGVPGTAYDQILACLHAHFSKAEIVLTVGADGVLYQKDNQVLQQGIYPVPVVDTTGAGDTFTGCFLACRARGMSAPACLKYASMASAIAVSRPGAAPSIPDWQEVEAFAALQG